MSRQEVVAIALGYAMGELKGLVRRDKKTVSQDELLEIVEHLEWLLFVQLPSSDGEDK